MRRFAATIVFVVAGLGFLATPLRAAHKLAASDPKTISATAPTEAEVTTAMKAAWESPAGGLNEAKTIEIKSMKISAVSRPWANQADVGSPGYQIWTAKIHFLTRRHYKTRTVVCDYDYYFDLSVNTLGEWVVQTSSQAGSKRTPLPDEPASDPASKSAR